MHTDANHVVIKTGYGKFYAANDGANTFAVITELPNVEFAAGQAVSVDNLPAVQAVSQNGAWSASVNNFPAVQAVSQNGVFTVSVDNLPTVQQVEQVKAATYTPKAKADFATNNHAIAENLNRVSLILKAAPANTGEIWIGTGADNGVPLFAGESIELNTTAAINLYATNTADNCYLSEVIQ